RGPDWLATRPTQRRRGKRRLRRAPDDASVVSSLILRHVAKCCRVSSDRLLAFGYSLTKEKNLRRFRKRADFLRKGGGGEIRTHEPFRPSGFQDRRDQPLCHPSEGLVGRRH